MAVLAPACLAGPVYRVQIDTSTLNLTTAWLDLQFNPGANSWQDALAEVSGFVTDGTVLSSATPATPQVTGDVTGGPLPGALTFHNSSAFNDYFQRAVLGHSILFYVTFSGAAIDAPDGGVFSGTSFSVALYADDQSTPLIAGPPLGQLDIQVGGGVHITNNDPGPVVIELVNQTVPEPATSAIVSSAIAALAIVRRLRQRRAH